METDRIETRTDPRVTRTRNLIEEAFLAVMEEKGFEDLSIQDVTERAGINRATFYSHFEDKFALLQARIRSSSSEELKKRGLCHRSLERESVRELFRTVCSYVSGLHEHCRPPHEQLDWLLERQIKELTTEVLEEWLRSAKSDSECSAGLTAVAAGSAIYGLVQEWLKGNERQPMDAFVSSSLPLVTAILGI